jgi:hypothetical protein
MSLMINSEISKQFLLEEDAIEGFRKAVANNQIRLALQVLVEIVDAFMEGFEVLMEESEEEEASPEESTTVTEDLPKKDEVEKKESKTEEKEPVKVAAKKEIKTAEEK